MVGAMDAPFGPPVAVAAAAAAAVASAAAAAVHGVAALPQAVADAVPEGGMVMAPWNEDDEVCLGTPFSAMSQSLIYA